MVLLLLGPGGTRLLIRAATNLVIFSISSLPTLLISMSKALTKATPEGETLILGFSNFAAGMAISSSDHTLVHLNLIVNETWREAIRLCAAKSS